MDIPKRTNPNDNAQHERGIAQAKKRAEWDLGDASWAGVIVGAYLYPESDAEALAKEKEQ